MNDHEKNTGAQRGDNLGAFEKGPDVLERLALTKAREGKMDEAILLFEQALESCRDSKDVEMRLGLLNNLGYALRLVGELQEAEAHLKTALHLIGPHSYNSTARLVLANLARTYGDALQYEDAANTFLDLVRRCAEAKEPYEEALARLDAANSLLNTFSSEAKPLDECRKIASRARETLLPALDLLKDKNLEVGQKILLECNQIVNMAILQSNDPADGDAPLW